MIKSFLSQFVFFVFAALIFIGTPLDAQQTVFTEDFNTPGTPQNSNFTTNGPIGTSRWTVTRSGNDFGAKIDQGFLTLTNDVGSAGNAKGWVLASTSTSNFLPAYSPVLSQNPGIVSWTFNMRQLLTNPSGLTDGKFGVAYVLAGTAGSTGTSGRGYAIMLGNGGLADAIRLVTYSNGIQNYYTKLSSTTSGLSDFGREYTSIRVEYNPGNNEWSMYVRKDGSNSFIDPKSGTLISQGKITNSEFVGESLTMTGAYWNAAKTAKQTAFFDNISVSVVAPEIISINPDSKIANSGAFTLNVDGKGFTTASKVYWNGSLRTTNYVSSTKITAAILDTDIPLPGIVPITVRNGSFISNAVDFEIESSGVPTLTLSKTILPFISTVQGIPSVATDTYTISGINLTASAVLTAPVNFELSVNNGAYADSQTLANSGGVLLNQPLTIKARLKSNAQAGNYTGNITHTTTGALTTKVVGVTGRVLATEPTSNASGLTFTNVTSTGFKLNWTTNGNGAQRLVLVRQLGAVDALPVDATTYNANSIFPTGSEIGTGNYVVYKGSGNSVQVSSLNPSTVYHISIVEFNGLPGTENYRASGAIGNTTTLNSPLGLQVKFADTSYKIDFDNTVDGVNLDTFQGAGIAKIAEPGQLDSDSWAFSGFSGGIINFGGESLEDSSYENGTSDGEEDDTGIYAFNVGTFKNPNYTLGIQPGGTGTSADFSPGSITLKIQNQTGSTMTSVNVGYKVYVYNDQESSSRIRFSYGSSATGTYTDEIIADVVSPATADLAPGWKAYYRVVTIPTGNIANNAYYYIRWSGSLVSGSGAQDEFAIDDIEVIANPVAPNTVSFDGIAEDFVLQGNASLSADLSVQTRLQFNGGKLSIKDKTLTIAGTVDNEGFPAGLTGGSTSKLVVRGNLNPTLSFDQTTPGATNLFDSFSLIGVTANTVKVANPFLVNQLLQVDALQTLDLVTIPLGGTLTSIQNNGIILTQNTSAIPFSSGKTWNGTGILNMNAASIAQTLVAGTYNNLTLSATAGTTAVANVTVNGKLDLPAANASSTKGSLDMASFTLTMGPDGVNTGVGEVTGIIKRDGFVPNKLYTFGHPNSSIIFPPAGTLPTSMSAKLTIGAAPSWRAGAIQRQFDIIQTGGISTKAIIRQHYLDSELNGNTETKLVFWGHKVTGSVNFEQGKSSNNLTDNWVEISNANVGEYFENQFDKVYITLDDTQGLGQIVWNGSVSDSWTTIQNWTPNVKPGTDTKVIIPDATTTINDPTLNPSETIGSLVIEAGAIVNSTNTSQLSLTAGAGAWQNNGVFNPATGTSSVIFNNLDATISGSTTFNNVTIPIGGGIRPSEGNYMSIAGTLTNNGTMFTTLIPNTIEFKGTNQIIPAPGGEAFGGYHHLIVNGTGATFASTTLNVRGNLTLNQTVPFTGKTINLAGVSDQTIVGTAAINFNNLIVNKETGAVILAKDIRVDGTLTLTKGNIVIGDKNLTLGSNPVSGTFSTNNMIVADGTGVVRRPFTGIGSYLFPIGELDGAPSYAPITVELTAGDFSNAFVGVNVTHSKHPNNNSVQNYLDKYWNVQQTGISNAVATITAKYDPADISGPQGEIAAAQLNGVFNVVTNPWKKFGVLSNNTLVAENAILTSGQISAFTGLKAGTISLEVYGYGDFCLNSTHTMNAVTSGGDAPFTYEWSNGLPNAVQVDIPTTTVGKTDYTLTVRDANGFSATDTNIPVYIFPQSNGGIIAKSTQQICAGTVPTELKLTGSIGKILHWQKSTDINFSANTESNPNNVTNLSNFTTTLSGAEIGPVTATTYIRAVLQNGDCAEKYSSVATVIIKTTTWNGATLGWSDGLPNATTSLIFAGNYTTSDLEKLEACSCEVNNGVVLTVNPNTSITIKDAIINNGSVIIESDGNLIQLNDAAINSGNVLVKRKLTFRNADRKEYNYLISPVENGNLKTDLYRKDDGSAVIAPSVLYYNETNNRFYNSSGAYIPGRSLAIKEPAYNSGAVPIAFFYGKPVNGKVAYSLAFSGESFGYNLVGNPYPSNLDLNVLFKDNSTSIEPTFRFWDNTVNGIYEQLGSNYTGNAYAIFNAVTGPGGTGVSAVGVGKIAGESPRIPNNIVKVGQGFMVKAVGENKVLNYSNHIRLEDNTGSVFYGKSKQDDRYWLHMTAPSGITSTIAVVYFAGGNNLFGAEDSRALENSDLIYSIVQGEQVSIDGRSSFSNADEISLGTQHFTAGNYTIALGDQEGVFSQGQNIYLKDKQTGMVTNLSEDGYVFAANSGASTGRFEIIYRPETVLVTDTKVKESITVYRDQDDFVVKSPKIMSMIQVYDSSGKLITVLKANDKRAIFNVSGIANGMYVLKITTVDGEVTTRKISR